MPQDLLSNVSRIVESLLSKRFLVPQPQRLDSRMAAMAQFMKLEKKDAAGATVLQGTSSQILEASESFSAHDGQVNDYVLTLIVVTPGGHYFLFKSNSQGKPYLSLLPLARAKLVLKGKFRPYHSSDA